MADHIIFLIYLLVISVITFFAYGLDKLKAKGKSRRTPEKVLLGLSLFGGAIGGALGMAIFRHKTKHFKFMFGIPVIIVIQAAAILALFYFEVLQIV